MATGCAAEILLQSATQPPLGECVANRHSEDEDAEERYLSLTCDAKGNFLLGIDCDPGCLECGATRTGTSGSCLEEQHGDESEFVRVVCDVAIGGSGTGGSLRTYDGDDVKGCQLSAGTAFDTQFVEGGVCVLDEHGHYDHAERETTEVQEETTEMQEKTTEMQEEMTRIQNRTITTSALQVLQNVTQSTELSSISAASFATIDRVGAFVAALVLCLFA